jgi:hypothetical protein
LSLKPGDEIAYELREGRAFIRPNRPERATREDPFALFTEWSSPEDEEAYAVGLLSS